MSGPGMAAALRLAREAAERAEVPIGAVVIHDGKIIAEAHNLRETDQNPVAHAEVLVLQAAARVLGSWRLTGCTLVVTLEPCPMCLAAAQLARVDEIVYGAEDPKGGALSLGYRLHEDPKTNHRFRCTFAPDPECGRVLSEFFAAKRRN